jgi:hypothetical protein
MDVGEMRLVGMDWINLAHNFLTTSCSVLELLIMTGDSQSFKYFSNGALDMWHSEAIVECPVPSSYLLLHCNVQESSLARKLTRFCCQHSSILCVKLFTLCRYSSNYLFMILWKL